MNLSNGRIVKSLAALSIASILAVSTLHAGESSPAAGDAKERNRELVVGFLDLAMNKHQVPEAANRYLTDAYIQHNPNVADGRPAFVDAFVVFLKENPERSWTPKRVFVDGDYVVVHGLYKNHVADRGIAAVDIFRIKDGRIDEHWDVLQPIPRTAANPHPMF